MINSDYIWLIEVIDSIGNIRWKIQTNNLINAEMLYISIGMTDEKTIDRIREITGIKNKTSYQPKNINAKRMFYFQVAGSKAYELLKCIYPYLITKKETADKMFNIIQNKEGKALIKIKPEISHTQSYFDISKPI